MMDSLMERGNFIQVWQQQLDAELARGQSWAWPSFSPRPATAEQVTLPDGASLTLRPAVPDDLHQMWKMHRRLSANTLYYRYLRAYQPSLADLTQICTINEQAGRTLVATSGRFQKQIVAVAYYLKNKKQPGTAEVAFLVEDRFQGRGLGRLLLQRLIQIGRVAGLTTLEAFVHPENGAMLHLLRHSGLPFSEEAAYDLHELRLQLVPAATFTKL
jgi:RimJ/RimL family protein N-acetyltransferase